MPSLVKYNIETLRDKYLSKSKKQKIKGQPSPSSLIDKCIADFFNDTSYDVMDIHQMNGAERFAWHDHLTGNKSIVKYSYDNNNGNNNNDNNNDTNNRIMRIYKRDKLYSTILIVLQKLPQDIVQFMIWPKLISYWNPPIVQKPAKPKSIRYHRHKTCDGCDASSNDTEILCHYSGMTYCIECIEADDELDGLKWEDI
jgi:hypothetical protein